MLTSFENFFTFPFLDESDTRSAHAGDRRDSLVRWLPDRQLQRHLAEIWEQNPQLKHEATLVQFLLDRLGQNPLPTPIKRHLTAFLARFSSEAAWKVKQELLRLDRIPSDLNVLFKDLFQTALEAAIDPKEFFKNFDGQKTLRAFWYPTLKQYVDRKMTGLLCDKIRAMEGMATYKRTALGLAARSSERRVTEALKFAGEIEPQLSEYVLAWQCFQEARQAQQIDLHAPQIEQFEVIASRYRRYRSKLPLVRDDDLKINATTMEMWLKKIGGAIRNYLDRPLASLDERLFADEEETSSRLERLVDPSTVLVGEALSSQEIESEVAECKAFIDSSLATLDRQTQFLPLLIHGLRLVQTPVGVELDKDQSYVSRHYQKLLNRLLQQIGAWAIDRHHLELDSETLNPMKDSLRSQLDRYYEELIDSFWQAAIGQLDSPRQRLWQLSSSNCDRSVIAAELRISETQVPEMLAEMKQAIEENLALQIETWSDRPLKPQGPVRKQLAALTVERGREGRGGRGGRGRGEVMSNE